MTSNANAYNRAQKAIAQEKIDKYQELLKAGDSLPVIEFLRVQKVLRVQMINVKRRGSCLNSRREKDMEMDIGGVVEHVLHGNLVEL